MENGLLLCHFTDTIGSGIRFPLVHAEQQTGLDQSTHTSFIIKNNKGRLSVSGLGAKRPDTRKLSKQPRTNDFSEQAKGQGNLRGWKKGELS